MKITLASPALFEVKIHAFELSALVAAARWVVEGCEGELPEEAINQLRQVLKNYDEAMRRLT